MLETENTKVILKTNKQKKYHKLQFLYLIQPAKNACAAPIRLHPQTVMMLQLKTKKLIGALQP